MGKFVRLKRMVTLFTALIAVTLFLPLTAFTTPATAASSAKAARTVSSTGNLDCNGFSSIQKPLKMSGACTDFVDVDQSSRNRGYDNGHYVGHDEPSIQFLSSTPGSGNNVKWRISLPKEHKLPAAQTFENQIAFWFSMALCDNQSFPQGACIPNSDQNNPNQAGSAFLEMQFYPPGFPPFISSISCDLTHWCASLHINSLECIPGGGCNSDCTEPTNFGFIQTDGVPTGPAGPDNATDATFTPNAHTLLMNQGDDLEITIKDTNHGLRTGIHDRSTGKTGFMVASASNGFQSLNPTDCSPTPFDFHPEFNTAKFGNFVPWAVLQANVGFASEIGHFQPGPNGDNDVDDAPCFSQGVLVPGCLGSDTDFDGTSYLPDWPDGTRNTASPVQIRSVTERGVGPVSIGNQGHYTSPFKSMIFETTVSDSNLSNCNPDGSGCVVPPQGAAFYPFYAQSGFRDNCRLTIGNDIRGQTVNDFGRDSQYGPSNLPWFFGQNSSGIRPNPCIPSGNDLSLP